MNIINSIIDPNCEIDPTATIRMPCNLYGSKIGACCKIGPFVEVGGAVIGDRSIISSHSYICPKVHIGEDCFIAHGVMFTNDVFSDRPTYDSMESLREDFVPKPTKIGNKVRIGSGAVILPVEIGDRAIIGAGSVVTRDVPKGAIMYGNPARIHGYVDNEF